MRKDLQERITAAVSVPRKRSWYSRPRVYVGIMITALLGGFGIVFAARVVNYYDAIVSGELQDRLMIAELKREGRIDLLNNGNDPSIGEKDSKIIVVAFEDFECPFCKQAQPFIKKMIAKHGDSIRFVYKDFPLSTIHPLAQAAAEAAQCAHEQGKFWEYHDGLFANQDKISQSFFRALAQQVGLNLTQFNQCFNTGKYRREVTQDAELGSVLGTIGTPTFFINGELFAQGYSPELDAAFEKAIEYIKGL